MHDETEQARRARIAELNKFTSRINAGAKANATFTAQEQAAYDLFLELEAQYGKVWDSDGLRQDFEVLGFMAPFVVAKHKASGKKGTLEFTHSPRAYFNWVEDQR